MAIQDIAIIGGGIVGSTTAFHLAKLGHNVMIIDPELSKPISYKDSITGSKASLGILMGYVFRRSSGRSWKLRKRSMELWPSLLQTLSKSDSLLQIETPLIQIAKNHQEMEWIKKIINEKSHLGVAQLKSTSKESQGRSWPEVIYGGLISKQDGRIDPIKLLKSLMISLEKLQVDKINAKVISLQRVSTNKKVKWKLNLNSHSIINTDCIIICSALGSQSLLKTAGHEYPMESVLGQVIQLKLHDHEGNWENWPSVLNINGINLIPQKNNELLVGATLEKGDQPNKLNLESLKNLNGKAPNWLLSSSIENHWYGIRAKPVNQAAPLLEKIEPGLILNAGHYRNGILLAPACAEWVAKQIEN
ncbi:MULTISPECIES: FAD-dependent oxidoreductase [Prochlorococcus]|uniref:FAD dependent oxidoreductase n=1 Tax=Prochlorococcus marinus (strain SARG / CCMP1375 / SS120) TaxID=167539 RepID=Q7V9G3_PROMA|nr:MULTISPECIES: FAD-dependent oxidoreductase [Prochlorococcus]AAQ00914.1 FAD dependent oxidoreductase [Prochlorococcus marinus subsp. marinus str. CCMP1375]KGG10591.1 D-amino acid dehydrogenase small subunit [Prochlorococcus marinus str. LG]KGG19943.1 D-amino acid dehydrogenase small subunit [Prochlorococcus marinus str. SS2]KGG23837.1 D-amino acid dehydrogenase small subunit [Prochlorococcus marinus str. SS35]KGG31903.1 D-amino acid dehydrogenase small subunit [Prochlorococcus marinus str. S